MQCTIRYYRPSTGSNKIILTLTFDFITIKSKFILHYRPRIPCCIIGPVLSKIVYPKCTILQYMSYPVLGINLQPTVFAVISVPALISASPHIPQLIGWFFWTCQFLNQVTTMFRCRDIGIFHFASVKYSLKLQTGISPQRKMIETWFKNLQDQLFMRNLNIFSLNNFVSAQGAYYSEYGTSIVLFMWW